MKPTRRQFLRAGSAALVGLSIKGDRRIPGDFVNDSFQIGHQLRDHAPLAPAKRIEKHAVVIVGGGIAGLSAAWKLEKSGFRDFVLLEMNDQAGGNSRWGENEITAYPWAAHYVPVPGPGAAYVRELFEELGVLKDGVWNERYLCFAPQERLFAYGRWQEGIEPAIGLTSADRQQFQQLENLMVDFRHSGGFTIPMELGISALHASLDQLSFGDWLRHQGLNSKLLHWYANYCCRDDFGALADETSAWAGIHYFASREPEEKGPITWPEGNGWIVRRLLERLGKFVRTGEPAYRILRSKGFTVQTPRAQYQAEFVIFAAPTFLAPYIVENMPAVSGFRYSPWLTANLTLNQIPRTLGGPLTWDNVVMNSPTLGYVDATHQTLRTQIDRTVWTFYWALAEGSEISQRKLLLEKDASYWKEAILHDLEKVHPDIRQCVSRIDLMRFGHAMARPVPGAIYSGQREQMIAQPGRLIFANSDLSGFSIFEEAQFRGVRAAERVLAHWTKVER